jgi:hypothetical protein
MKMKRAMTMDRPERYQERRGAEAGAGAEEEEGATVHEEREQKGVIGDMGRIEDVVEAQRQRVVLTKVRTATIPPLCFSLL